MITLITNLIAPAAQKADVLTGIRRSRFSFHFNTARRRRWLLVQLVTAPALPGEADDISAPIDTPDYSDIRSEQPTPASLLDNYVSSRLATCY
ncbi:MAG TPA: hypothetical protein VLQ48_07935 [Chloroflexia bacterium]|nr:hypothetical protein [Chloroflexia bacterium]